MGGKGNVSKKKSESLLRWTKEQGVVQFIQEAKKGKEEGLQPPAKNEVGGIQFDPAKEKNWERENMKGPTGLDAGEAPRGQF